MDVISTLSAAGMQARMQSLEMLANNLANLETGGYKADREQFTLYLGPDASADQMTGANSTLPVIERPWTDPTQGVFRNTANPFDLAIDGPGMFVTQTPRGIRYTRDGSFRLNSKGILAATDGSPVLARNGATISLEPDQPVRIEEDGAVLQGGQTVAQIGVVQFAPDALEKTGSNYFAPVEGAKPEPASGKLVQGKLEQSNVGAAESAVRLVTVMRHFEALQKAANLGNELNRRAIEEIAKVTT